MQVLAESGVPVSNTFHMEVRLNGQFFGLFSFVEMVDRTFLKVGCYLGLWQGSCCESWSTPRSASRVLTKALPPHTMHPPPVHKWLCIFYLHSFSCRELVWHRLLARSSRQSTLVRTSPACNRHPNSSSACTRALLHLANAHAPPCNPQSLLIIGPLRSCARTRARPCNPQSLRIIGLLRVCTPTCTPLPAPHRACKLEMGRARKGAARHVQAAVPTRQV